MRGCAAGLGAVVGLLCVVAVGYFLFSKSPVPAKSMNGPVAESSTGGTAPSPQGKVEAPRDSAQKLRDEVDKKRVPFFRFLHERFAESIERATILDDIETLDLYVPNSDEQTIRYIVENAVAPSAAEYAFKGVRFYVRNPSTAVEPFRVVAEASVDRSGRWNTFFK